MEISADAASVDSGDVASEGSADLDHSPGEDIETTPGSADGTESSDAASAEPSKSLTTKQVQDRIEKVAGLRVHAEDAAKLKEFIKGAYGAFDERAKLDKLVKAITSGDEDELGKLIDLDALANKRLARRLDEQLKSPEDREKESRESEVDSLRKKLADFETKAKEKELDELTQREIAKTDREWTDALKKSGLPARRENLVRMAQIAKDYLAKGIDLPIEHIADLVHEEREHHEKERQRKDFEETSDEDFDVVMRNLSGKALERVRQWFLKQVQGPRSSSPKQSGTAQSQPRSRKEVKPLSPDDFHKLMGH